MDTIINYIIYFTFYSFIGWFCETIYCSIPAKKFVYRGFLTGPVCPIYGFGAVFILLLLEPIKSYILPCFFSGMVIASVIEYFTSYLMEKIFHARWWDYSNKKFNLNGRICLLNSILFGVMAVVLTQFIHPFISNLIYKIPYLTREILAMALIVIFVLDTILTSQKILSIHKQLALLESLHYRIKAKIESLKEEQKTQLEMQFREHIVQLKSSITMRRLLSAFPKYTPNLNKEFFKNIKTHIENKLKKH